MAALDGRKQKKATVIQLESYFQLIYVENGLKGA
jgi:hypothetical protein